MGKINLFCLPFAGGSKYSYRPYEERTPNFLNLIPLDYPGRGGRMREPLANHINDLIDDLYTHISESISAGDYAIYGHSMGGLVCCLLARKIAMEGKRLPLHIFITGASGPSAPKEDKRRYALNKAEFIEELKRLNGCPDEILNDPELLDHFEPIIRADFKISETYDYTAAAPLNIPFTVITGSEEDMTRDEIRCWQKESSTAVDFKVMPGNHFFIFRYPATVMEVLSKKLVSYLKSPNYERR